MHVGRQMVTWINSENEAILTMDGGHAFIINLSLGFVDKDR
jgi:hypothetical protein